MMRPITLGFTFAASAMLVASATVTHAQGTLSAQGFGYPPGQLSTRSAATGGAVAEFDGRSPINPAALGIDIKRGEIYGQYDPEIRRVTGPAGSSRTTTARFPNVGLIMPLGRKLAVSAGASTFLDRTWATEAERVQVIGEDTVNSNEILKSDGGITDLRVGAAYAITSRIRVGIAGHYFSGSNIVQLLQLFPDSLRYGNVSQTNRLHYAGTGLSAGAVLDLPYGFNVAASGRMGNGMRLMTGDTVLTRADVPNRMSAAFGYTGIPGTTMAVRYARESWTSMVPLSTSGATAVDATEWNAGIESAGPNTGVSAVVLRAGFRVRDLPFQVAGTTVRETSYGGGLGIPFSGERASIDIAVLRSTRTGVSGIKESAYNLSFGMRVRP